TPQTPRSLRGSESRFARWQCLRLPRPSVPEAAHLVRESSDLGHQPLDERRDIPDADDVVRGLGVDHRLDPIQVRRGRWLVDGPRLLLVAHERNDTPASLAPGDEVYAVGAPAGSASFPPSRDSLPRGRNSTRRAPEDAEFSADTLVVNRVSA